MAAARSKSNQLVVAGPGAGKTELLAQRASFLLETGNCPAQMRILAISFKRDAAKNLNVRVRERCPESADRFDSLTLDAFAKSLVDRFLPALPKDWRPSGNYQVRTTGINLDDARLWLSGATVPEGQDTQDVNSWTREDVRRILDKTMHGAELPYDAPDLNELWGARGRQWWKEQLRLPPGTPSLSFPMLNRLAAYLLRSNPKITAALRLTYSDVFLDEFQDTTASQWDLVRSAFLGSASTMTAVGDGKQRIMVWAGAKTDVFERFEEDFAAMRLELVRNYRSAPELVHIQHLIAQAVESGTAEPVAAKNSNVVGTCAVLEFKDPEQEASHLASLIHGEIASGFASPRDFCILVRQRAGEMVKLLQEELRKRGVRLRDESALQDLRAEPVTAVVLSAIRLATRKRDAEAWAALVEALAGVSGLSREKDGPELERLATAHKDCAARHISASTDLRVMPSSIVGLVGVDRFKSAYRQYMNGDYLDQTLAALGEALHASLEATGDARRIADDIDGLDVVPAMTIHKSKGLEFGTVVFLGLEDGQWWGFRDQPDEEKRAFFVAFSRAIHRVIFTVSDERDTRWGRRAAKRVEVGALHDVLLQAGVPRVDCRSEE